MLSSATTGIPALKADATASLMMRLAFKLAETGARTSGILELDAASKWLANRDSLCKAVIRRAPLLSRLGSTALGSDGQGPQGLSFDFLDFLLICLIFYLSFLFWELDQQRTSRAPSSRASVRNISFEIELNV